MRFVDIIRKKRDGGELTADEVAFAVASYTRGEVPDYQMAAWLMAVWLRKMSRAELAALTEAMLHSGKVLDFSDLPGRKVDKHSTGGVGDKTSLILAPLAAAAGVFVPMISGRGLGHSGGTLDKLEAIPGFRVGLSEKEARAVLKKVGCVMMGQTDEIAPADRKLYSLRDVTATVESPYLMCASIMSKKLAEGVDGLVLDVKTGSGAFLKDEASTFYLAELMVETGRRMGKRMVALITNMDQPLGRAVGNALEVAECVEVLRGGGPADTRELTLELAAWMLHFGGRAATPAEGKVLAARLLDDGSAYARFLQMVEAQGGDPRAVQDTSRLPHARHTAEFPSLRAGTLLTVDCEQIGMASVLLGAGRAVKEESVDPAVGLIVHKKPGDAVAQGEPLCTLHYNSAERLEQARLRLEYAFHISAEPPRAALPLVWSVFSEESQRLER